MSGEHPAARFESYDLKHTSIADAYKLYMGAVIPRPIALVSSLNPDGKVNVAPFSNFMVISSFDGFLGFSVGNDDENSKFKDTLVNVQNNREFVINLASVDMAAKVQHCSEPFPADISEADEAEPTPMPPTLIATPRIAECKVHFECRLHEALHFGRTHLVVGKVVAAHARADMISNFKIDPTLYSPLGRIGGRRYCGLGDFIDV